MSVNFIAAKEFTPGHWGPVLPFEVLEGRGLELNIVNGNFYNFCDYIGLDFNDAKEIEIDVVIETMPKFFDGLYNSYARQLHYIATVGKRDGATHIYAG